MNSVQVVISWPHQVAADSEQGKWLLYPEDVPTVDGEGGERVYLYSSCKLAGIDTMRAFRATIHALV